MTSVILYGEGRTMLRCIQICSSGSGTKSGMVNRMFWTCTGSPDDDDDGWIRFASSATSI
jgi:hypothetical protein